MKYNAKVTKKRASTFFGASSKDNVGPVVFLWDKVEWNYVGHNEVWVMPHNFDGVDDPVVELHPSKAARRKSVVAFTKSGETLDVAPDQHTIVTHANLEYIVATLPTVVKVFLNGSTYNVLGFYGYHEATKQVIVCTLNGGGLGYGADSVNGDAVFRRTESELSSTRTAPAYAIGRPSVSLEKKPVDVLADELSDFRSSKAKIVQSMIDEHGADKELAEEIFTLREYGLKKKLAEEISPTNQNLVVHVEISDDQLKRVLRRKSSVSKMRGEVAATNVSTFDPIAEVRKQLKLGPGDPFPMPINTAKKGKDSPPIPMPRIVSEKVDGEEML